MNEEDIKRACAHARRLIERRFPRALPIRQDARWTGDPFDKANHCLYMINIMQNRPSQVHIPRDQEMYAVGFIQAFLWTTDLSTLEEVRAINRGADMVQED